MLSFRIFQFGTNKNPLTTMLQGDKYLKVTSYFTFLERSAPALNLTTFLAAIWISFPV